MARLRAPRTKAKPNSPSPGRIRGFCGTIGRMLLTIGAALVVFILLLRWLPPPCSSFMVQHQVVSWLQEEKSAPLRYHWVDYEQISPQMALAVIAAEDQRFPEHFGLDLSAIHKAMQHNRKGASLHGASTLSQQTAKNLFLWGGRSYLRKGLEAALTLSLELLWSKKRILEVYLNIAEFGDGIYGVQAASRQYFHKDASRLTRYEAALLAGVLPSPQRLHANRPSSYLRGRARWITRYMRKLGGTHFLSRIH